MAQALFYSSVICLFSSSSWKYADRKELILVIKFGIGEKKYTRLSSMVVSMMVDYDSADNSSNRFCTQRVSCVKHLSFTNG